ncbi:hypothetical protein PA598K_01659 [Paenibacillus sp. 598K]|uniref:hypothetical protein n=1 Tax=Paenibacillus sp. 598K TaxID=1117987 RepID=UPI000FFAA3EC|nr:hypothetical protein [Paenibacillus sp. 598K]GBF73372.1 hypothetical protein PA598K_01659 [Paenibacillus sp. 598K]
MLLLIVGCGDAGMEELQADAMSAREGCLVQQGDAGARICYGMSVEEIEAVAGAGTSDEPRMRSYAGGLKVGYRGDKAVFLSIQGPESAYATVRGIAPGTRKDEMKSRYGSQYAIDETPGNLDYFYDLSTKTPLARETLLRQRGPEAMEETLVVSAMFDGEGRASRVMILDRRMAVYFN